MGKCPAVEIKNLWFSYGCHPVLKGVSLTVTAGEAVGITGPNGSGKTTLVRLMVGQLQPLAGDISILGHGVSGAGWRRRVSYVPQKAVHFNRGFPATVMEVVLSGRTGRRGLFRGFDASDRGAAEEALRALDIYSLKEHPLFSLSGGQQQRVFIARALAADPELLIMDEPTAGLDPSASRKLCRMLKKVNRERNLTLIIITHDLECAAGLISRRICLEPAPCGRDSCEMISAAGLAGGSAGVLPLYPGGRA